jgi:predicted DNA-binding protein YlxM (UPF0122 family)
MTDIPISPTIWKLAAAILTEKQLTVLELREKRGFSWNQLAITFNSTRANVREHHRAATKNLLDAIESAGGIDEALAANLADDDPETPEEKRELDRLWYQTEKKEIA